MQVIITIIETDMPNVAARVKLNINVPVSFSEADDLVYHPTNPQLHPPGYNPLNDHLMVFLLSEDPAGITEIEVTTPFTFDGADGKPILVGIWDTTANMIINTKKGNLRVSDDKSNRL